MRGPGRQAQRLQFVAVGQRYVTGFGQIMIFGRQPEDRHMRAAGGGGVFCFANRGRCFEDGKEWAAEERHLLAGHHCARAVTQPRDVFEDCVRRAEGAVLLFQQVAKSCTMSGGKYRGRGHPLGGIRAGRVERRECLAALREVQEQPAKAGQKRDGITLGLHRRLLFQRHPFAPLL